MLKLGCNAPKAHDVSMHRVQCKNQANSKVQPAQFVRSTLYEMVGNTNHTTQLAASMGDKADVTKLMDSSSRLLHTLPANMIKKCSLQLDSTREAHPALLLAALAVKTLEKNQGGHCTRTGADKNSHTGHPK